MPVVGQESGATGATDGALSLEVLIGRSIEAYGGEELLVGARRIFQEGTVTSTMRQGAGGRIVRLYERPVRLRVEIEYPGNESEVRILDGGRGWRNGGPVSGPMYQAMLLQAARLGLPAILIDFQASLQDLGEVERDGQRLRAVGLDFHQGLRVTVEIEPVSGRILRSEGTISGQDGRPVLTFATEYADFQDVDGFLVPFHEVNYAQGRRTGETRLDSVELLQEIPAGSFHPPVDSSSDPRESQRTRT
jgi:hypothetical protein